MAAFGAGCGDDQHDWLAEICAASARGFAVSGFRHFKTRAEDFPTIKLSAVTPEMPAIQADLKPGGGRFKRVNYMNPEVQFDKGNEWVEYFQKNFVQ